MHRLQGVATDCCRIPDEERMRTHTQAPAHREPSPGPNHKGASDTHKQRGPDRDALNVSGSKGTHGKLAFQAHRDIRAEREDCGEDHGALGCGRGKEP